MATKFRAHETFFIRKGWLSKGMRYVSQKPDVFTDNAIYPVCLNRKPFHLSLLAKYFKDPDCFYAGVDWHFIHIFVTNSFFRSKILS